MKFIEMNIKVSERSHFSNGWGKKPDLIQMDQELLKVS